VAIHGGAGDLPRDDPQLLAEMRERLDACLQLTCAVLDRGGSALEAVSLAVSTLEDAACFNAGHGAVLRHDGSVRLDASVMCGETASAGGVTGARRVKNPVLLAARLLDEDGIVLLSGDRADDRAGELGLELCPPEYFVTERRRQQLLAARQRRRVELDHEGQTVGAVARDRRGHLAAATSTGGMTNADAGRVGDSPILGAGTWASDGACAVSATGTGEAFLRCAFSHDVYARVHFAGCSLERATADALEGVRRLGGRGGCVAVDAAGRVALPFLTAAMPRAFRDLDGRRGVAVGP
jgi:beta-aspartyl-peptidase (threonine type)